MSEEDIEKRFEAFLSGNIVPPKGDQIDKIRKYLRSFTIDAKALFKREAGMFFVGDGNLKHLNEGGKTIRDLPSGVRCVSEWYAMHMLHILSRGEKFLENDEGIDRWLTGLGFDSNKKIWSMDIYVKISLW